MQEFLDYEITEEDFEKQRWGERYNPALEITYNIDGTKYINTLQCGFRDNITCFICDHKDIYVLTTNSGLNYAGLEIFNSGQELGDIFLDDNGLQENNIDPDNMADIEMINFLSEWIS